MSKLMLVKDVYEFAYPKNAHFKCEKCALCCGDTSHRVRRILLLKFEAERISHFTGKSTSFFAEKIVGFEPYVFQMKKTYGKCIFLEGSFCTVYCVRPLICVFYPFELEKISENRFAFGFTEECPAIGKGRKLGKSYFERLFAEFVRVMERNKK